MITDVHMTFEGQTSEASPSSFSIHITDKTLKRQSSTTYDVDTIPQKKSKLHTSQPNRINDSSVLAPPPSSKHSSSLRHLFSFSEKSAGAKKKKKKKSKPFTFFPDSQAQTAFINDEGDEPDDSGEQDEQDGQGEQGERGEQGEQGEQFEQFEQFEQDNALEDDRFSEEPLQNEHDIHQHHEQPRSRLRLPDAIDNDTIMEVARKFCRQASIQSLDDEWEAENGMREQMRRHFKQKRQNLLRGRKLGAAPTTDA